MKRLQKLLPFFALLLMLGAGLFAAFQPAGAQSSRDYDDILDRIEQIEKELRTLQRSAARGKLPVTSGTRAIMLPSDQPPLLANLEIRMSQLERELRNLTGRIEELVNRQDILEREMDLFRKDVEFQLREGRDDGTLLKETIPGETPSTSLSLPANQGATPPSLTLPSGDPASQYDFAFSQLKRGDFTTAEAAFEAFLEAHPDDALAGNAQYWLGETFYVRKDYPRAAEAFLKGFQNYRDSNKGPDSLLKLGMTLSAMDKPEEACAAFAELENRYPEAIPAIKEKTEAQKERLGC